MKIDILASGSAGNCIALTANGKTILIDAGVAKTKIEKRLLEAGISAPDIIGIFITHAHADHVKGLPLAAKYIIPVYATDGEWKSIREPEDHDGLVRPGNTVMSSSDGWEVAAFKTYHDSYEPVGYTANCDDYKVSICLDTGKVDDDMLEAMAGSHAIIIEANHDESMVEQNEQYPSSVKARILSDIGHLSNEQTAAALSQLVRGRGERIYLTHLSSNNNMPELARMTAVSALRRCGFTEGKHYYLEVL
ncbi:Phosphoribosyl 1,2-cyclic phosphodiesterase [Paenibacillus sp. UNCCL117]|uniref:MBL fold metallo-hydrolase n=1 Tax=unclassified Paenibacillus TaxID=185978 RepID=UPI00088FFC72|nr:MULTISPECIES: MBL fold metallo-hydrolase [unclassified Paenibacillus]SDD28405.1 Phosphoribosyl 1,2-cyclic phosphodiesterase [Paenibacillus sp. cl123]SFW40920.1 Phosphoribosyl 1,2-cyclic phosphodiesterase [Paenibacillus sp. UNCCL117]